MSVSANPILKRISAQQLYTQLLRKYGEQHWWPADTDFEMMIGAVLTQHTAWHNVEQSIARLKNAHILTPSRLALTSEATLMQLIQPSGFMTAKARTCIHIAQWVIDQGFTTSNMPPTTSPNLRNQLLAIPGVGPETADVIRLYAFNQPCFIWDAYARRLTTTLGYTLGNTYELAHKNENTFINIHEYSCEMLKEYHALIVAAGKQARVTGQWL